MLVRCKLAHPIILNMWVRGHGDQADSNPVGQGSNPCWPATIHKGCDFMLNDEELKQAIKKVTVKEITVPPNFETFVNDKNLDYSIHSFGVKGIVEFFKRVGEGEFRMSPWLSMPSIREAAKEAGFILTKNKINGNPVIFANSSIKNSVVFTPEMLDIKDVEHADTIE